MTTVGPLRGTLTRPAKRSEIAAGRGGGGVEPGEGKTEKKVNLPPLLGLSFFGPPAFSQEQTGSSAVPLTTTVGPQPLVGQQVQSSAALFPPVTATIRVFGSPTVQPARGLGIECTPVEQSIAGVIIGPTDLCDR